MRTIMPRCPQCGNASTPHCIKVGGKWERTGFWCVSCNKPVDLIARPDPLIYNMDIRDFLSTHKKRYQVIYADPPWRYEVDSLPKNRLIENHYTTMPLEDVAALPVLKIAKDPAILFLWTTSPKTEEGLAVMKAWGFAYRTQIIWEKYSNGKLQIGLGNNVRGSHELLLIGKKGEFPTPKYRPPSTITARRTEHSVKPDKFYEIIENMYPTASRIELFARKPRPGWASVGNQIETAESVPAAIQAWGVPN